MLDLLILFLALLLLTYFYLIKYKQFLPWYKLNEQEAIVSEFNHVFTPSSSNFMDKAIETAHEMKKDNIIEIINHAEDETYLDIFDEQKRRIYHFFCPKYLLFSGQYNHTHFLENGKKYSFFLTTINPHNLATFRQATFDKIKAIPYLSTEKELIYYQNDEERYITKVIDDLKQKNYRIKDIERIKGKNMWPHGGTIFSKNLVLRTEERILIVSTIKNSIQSLEIITDEDKYFFPIEGKKLFTHWLVNDNQEPLTMSIIERNVNLYTNNSYLVIFHFYN